MERAISEKPELAADEMLAQELVTAKTLKEKGSKAMSPRSGTKGPSIEENQPLMEEVVQGWGRVIEFGSSKVDKKGTVI
eukprot:CAMPEP_0170487228 /NCGR_PEP_ID=MMETSP0208-20121228/6082_1 /TAXON_ID=197538 /ORGANISM="Strombidium inclinatum, Strain S3" /LENGTH=78 /DNA_ID=CAMNT_0010761445 /DNA_START=1812 /DNA_END=2045 /DNA_ORIENTATION=+